MKKFWIVVIVVLALIALWSVAAFIGFTNSEENMKNVWMQVEADYGLRADAVSQLIAAMDTLAADSTGLRMQEIKDVCKAASDASVDPDALTPENIASYRAVQDEFSNSIGLLWGHGAGGFTELWENVISAEVGIGKSVAKFDESVYAYNASIEKLPSRLFARMFRFSPAAYFEAEPDTDIAPVVQF